MTVTLFYEATDPKFPIREGSFRPGEDLANGRLLHVGAPDEAQPVCC